MKKLLALVALAGLGLVSVGCEQPKPAAPPPKVETPPAGDAPKAETPPAEKPAEPAKP